jgi:hypothetical protein
MWRTHASSCETLEPCSSACVHASVREHHNADLFLPSLFTPVCPLRVQIDCANMEPRTAFCLRLWPEAPCHALPTRTWIAFCSLGLLVRVDLMPAAKDNELCMLHRLTCPNTVTERVYASATFSHNGLPLIRFASMLADNPRDNLLVSLQFNLARSEPLHAALREVSGRFCLISAPKLNESTEGTSKYFLQPWH